jgi:hypothetical protein
MLFVRKEIVLKKYVILCATQLFDPHHCSSSTGPSGGVDVVRKKNGMRMLSRGCVQPEGGVMHEICITINGERHCFRLPRLLEKFPPPGPEPRNFPELELATAVLELVNFVQPAVARSQLTSQLSEIATQFIQQVQKGLPQGVELKEVETART